MTRIPSATRRAARARAGRTAPHRHAAECGSPRSVATSRTRGCCTCSTSSPCRATPPHPPRCSCSTWMPSLPARPAASLVKAPLYHYDFPLTLTLTLTRTLTLTLTRTRTVTLPSSSPPSPSPSPSPSPHRTLALALTGDALSLRLHARAEPWARRTPGAPLQAAKCTRTRTLTRTRTRTLTRTRTRTLALALTLTLTRRPTAPPSALTSSPTPSSPTPRARARARAPPGRPPSRATTGGRARPSASTCPWWTAPRCGRRSLGSRVRLTLTLTLTLSPNPYPDADQVVEKQGWPAGPPAARGTACKRARSGACSGARARRSCS